MKEVSITFDPAVPEEIKPQVSACLLEFISFAPRWLAYITVLWNSQSETAPGNLPAIARIEVFDHYRSARMTVHPRWMDFNNEMHRLCVLHEINHINVAPLQNEAEALIETLTEEDSEMRAYAQNRLEKIVESTVEDLTLCYLCNFEGQKAE